jgi:hypothetical protein
MILRIADQPPVFHRFGASALAWHGQAFFAQRAFQDPESCPLRDLIEMICVTSGFQVEIGFVAG